MVSVCIPSHELVTPPALGGGPLRIARVLGPSGQPSITPQCGGIATTNQIPPRRSCGKDGGKPPTQTATIGRMPFYQAEQIVHTACGCSK